MSYQLRLKEVQEGNTRVYAGELIVQEEKPTECYLMPSSQAKVFYTLEDAEMFLYSLNTATADQFEVVAVSNPINSSEQKSKFLILKRNPDTPFSYCGGSREGGFVIRAPRNKAMLFDTYLAADSFRAELKYNTDWRVCPEDEIPEYAFVYPEPECDELKGVNDDPFQFAIQLQLGSGSERYFAGELFPNMIGVPQWRNWSNAKKFNDAKDAVEFGKQMVRPECTVLVWSNGVECIPCSAKGEILLPLSEDINPAVHHPDHYTWIPGHECIDIIQHFPFLIGSAIKYLFRCGRKDDEIQELEKAIFLINKQIALIKDKREKS
ncbi:MAG: DUF3310 domain-containing protein [Bacteroidia bacterium]|nr:DUF3310 domain-containing protein [Bacteroidia bacterium]